MSNSSSESTISITAIRAALTTVAEDLPELAAVYAYGSRTTGTARDGSDLDLALVLGHDARPGALFAETVAARLGERLGFQVEVDAHRVEHLPLPVLGRVVTQGVLIFERDPSRRVEFETATRRLYFDFLPFLERDARETLRRG